MIHRKETTASTNLDARAGEPGDVFTAEFQTAGRGRLDHVWQSARSENLMFSMVLDVSNAEPAEIATLPLVVGFAVIRALSPTLALKWPNDILFNGRKLCGILCERVGSRVIAGIGVNVNQTDFPADVAARAISWAQIVGHRADREILLRDLIRSVETWHARWQAEGFAALHPLLAEFDWLKGRHVSVRATDDDANPIAGICGGIQSDGSLLVGTTSVYAGEARVTLLN